MKQPRYMPIGIQDFEKLRTNNCAYVDKTMYVWDLAKTVSPYFLSRPRRFGKSLLLSTLEAYFLGKKDLFTGLALETLEPEAAELEKRDAWRVYPVFHFDLNAKKYDSKTSLAEILNQHLEKLETIYGDSKKSRSPEERFAYLLEEAHAQTGLQAVILVDEYDKPLLETLDDEVLCEDNRKTLKSFFGVIKSEDAHIRFALLTGVTKFSQVSVFSDLNNLNDISMDTAYNAVCGISETELTANFDAEIERLAAHDGLTKDECLAKLRETYDGYHFAPNTEGVYNPFSVLNTFSKNAFNYYWFQTGTPSFLIKAIEKSGFDLRNMETGVTANAESFAEYRFGYQSAVPLLYQSGYLTIKGYDSRFRNYDLMFPNKEVKYGFLDFLIPFALNVEKDTRGSFYIEKFVTDIESGNVDSFMTRLQSLLSAVPYSMSGEKRTVTEQTFQTGVFLVFQLMGQFTQVEVQSAKGRADIVVTTKDAVYVFEFKLTGTAADALAQIDAKDYAVQYNANAVDGRRIVKIGVGFEPDIPVIKDWLVAE